jgi:hypothetical protein
MPAIMLFLIAVPVARYAALFYLPQRHGAFSRRAWPH